VGGAAQGKQEKREIGTDLFLGKTDMSLFPVIGMPRNSRLHSGPTGVPIKQAEVQAEVLTEAFNVNLESLVTKDFLVARFAEQRAYIDTRFAEQDARWDKRFAEHDARWEKRFTEQNILWEKRFAEQNVVWEKRFAEQNIVWEKRFAQLEAKVDSNQRIFTWTQAIVVAAVILPYLERLMAL